MPPKPHNPLLRALAAILTVLVIVLGTAGATVFYMTYVDRQANAALVTNTQGEVAAEPVVVPGPIFVALEPFTVTLRDDYSNRILYAAITLRVGDQASRRVLTDYMPEVRDRVLLTLAAQDPKNVRSPENREKLAQDLAQVLQAPYQPQPQQPQITYVLFTAFVIQ